MGDEFKKEATRITEQLLTKSFLFQAKNLSERIHPFLSLHAQEKLTKKLVD